MEGQPERTDSTACLRASACRCLLLATWHHHRLPSAAAAAAAACSDADLEDSMPSSWKDKSGQEKEETRSGRL